MGSIRILRHVPGADKIWPSTTSPGLAWCAIHQNYQKLCQVVLATGEISAVCEKCFFHEIIEAKLLGNFPVNNSSEYFCANCDYAGREKRHHKGGNLQGVYCRFDAILHLKDNLTNETQKSAP